MGSVERVVEVAARGCTALGGLAIVAMMLSTDYDVFARQALSRPLTGLVELVEITVLASAMLGLPEAFLRDEQIRVDLVDSVVPPRLLRAIEAAALLLSIALLALLCVHVLPPLRDARMFGDLKPDLGVPVWPLHALVLFAFAASALTCALALRRALTGGRVER